MPEIHQADQQSRAADSEQPQTPREWPRRAFLGTAAVTGAALVGGGVWRVAAHASGGAPPVPAEMPAGGWGSGSFLQIIAHPDDDLYFMNPYVIRSITSGAPVVTAVMTAAEGDGRNIDTAAKNRNAVRVDYAGYSAARHNGLRGAYALMATGDRTSPWRREAVRLGRGLVVERNTLEAKPQVQLYFFNLCKGTADKVTETDAVTSGLRELWAGPATLEQETLPVPGSPVRNVQLVNRDGVIAALMDLLGKHHPTVVRTLDPDPEHNHSKTEYEVSDHVDHTATARFVLQALYEYHKTSGQTPAVENYRGYANRYWPYNLGKPAYEEKAKVLLTYAGADKTACPTHDCGDYQLGTDPYRSTHIFSTADRYSPSTTWMRRRSDGSLIAFAVLAGRVAYWTEIGPGRGEWTGPTFLDGGWITPSLAVVAGPQNRIHVVGLRRTEGKDGAVRVDVVHTVQNEPGQPFSAWESVAGPNSTEGDKRRQREVGVPAAAVDASGLLHVFVRDFGQGLSTRRQKDGGGWTAWTDLKGSLLQDAPTALTTSTGRIEVYVPGKTTITRWYQEKPNGPFLMDTHLHTTPAATGGVTAVESSRDRITLYFRQARTAHVLAYPQSDNGQGWPEDPTKLGGNGGTGPVAAACHLGTQTPQTVLAHRNGDDRLSIGGRTTGRVSWKDAGGLLTQAPSLALDHANRAVLAVVGADGRLHVARQEENAPDIRFGPWTAVSPAATTGG